jgi:ribosomal protein S18 acetylase RimI-like enzyme
MENESIITKITQLEQAQWQDYQLAFHYISNHYYDVTIDHSVNQFQVSFTKKPFPTPYEKMPDDSDKLFQPWWDDVLAWGIIDDDGELVAAIETAVEIYSNRLRVTELWVDDNYRRKGIAKALMDIAVKRAKDEKRRVVFLETQSCNEGAISFYLDYGFSLIGFDASAYQNDDIKRKEVRMEMGLFLG